MAEDEFITEMTNIGMTEYEAKVYQVLFQLKYASIHDIHETCAVPRNKIYETLESLEQKGFAALISTNPRRYVRCDIEKTFSNIRIRELKKIARAEEFLKSQENNEAVDRSQRAYELHSKWALENHLNRFLKKSKTELIIGVQDTEYFNKNIPEPVLKKLMRKLDLYIIVKDEEEAKKIPVHCYKAKNGYFKRMIDDESIDRVKMHTQNTKMMLISDRKAILNITEMNGETGGVVMLMNDAFMIDFALETLLQHIQQL